MSNIPSDLKYLESHEWARLESDGTVTVGISDHAQEALGDLVFVEVPEVGRALTKGGAAAVVESVKAASDVYAPISGEVTEGNPAIADDPAIINREPEGEGWFFKLRLSDPGELEGLMDEAAYREWVKSL
jgi:glycine cleavage system H protein